MRLSITILSTSLALAGCVPPPYPSQYPQTGYAQPYASPDGFDYSDGYPVQMIDGYQAEFIYAPEFGGWGYYDGGRRWHGAPPGMRDRLERSHPGGRGIPPFRGFNGGGRPGPGYAPGRPGGGGFFGNGPGQRPNRDQQPNRPSPPPNQGQGRPGPGGPPQQGQQRQGGQPPQQQPQQQPQQHRQPNGNCQPGQQRC